MARVGTLARPLILLPLLALIGACGGDDDGPTGLDPNEFELVAVTEGGLSGLAGTVVPEPVTVQVRRRDTGAPEEGATVSWSVTSGDAVPTRTSSPTDLNGEAQTRIELGPSAGEVRVRASVLGLPDVTLPAITALPAPTIASVSPTSVDPGDTVDVSVNDLPSGTSVRVLFDGEEAELTSRGTGDPALLRVVVPPPAGVCASEVKDVDVRVRVGGVTTAPQVVQVSVPDQPFQVGQVLVLQGTADLDCALLPADGGNASYLLAALTTAFETSGQFQVTLGASSVALAASSVGAPPLRRGFHDRLRAVERDLAARGITAARGGDPDRARLFAAPEVGSQREFWVLNDVDALSTESTEEDFDRVTATLRFKGANTLLYVDDATPANGLTEADIEQLGELYDRQLLEVDIDFFGEPTDVDANEAVIVLLTPVVNALSPRGSESIVIGFFLGLDLAERNPTQLPVTEFSNEAEILYGIVPDPDGQVSDAISRDRVLGLMPGIMVHETQHMINFRFKVFVNQLLALETLWLAEGMAHMAEELGGDAVVATGQTETADDLYLSNFNRAAFFLKDAEDHSLTAVSGGGTLGERGAAWLFMRWLADQYGDFILRPLTQAAENGVSNVEARTGESFFRLFADWAIALWAEDQDIPGLAARYQIPKWQLRSIIQIEPEGGGEPVYALQPLQRTFAEVRADSVSTFMGASSPFYVELDAAGDNGDLQLQLDASSSSGVAILRVQ